MSIPLLKTKLYIPPRRSNQVLRPRLMARLAEVLDLRHRLTLVSAKAGSGKTTLVSEWLHQQEWPATWLSLDGNDNDPQRFVSYLVAALQQRGIKISQAVLDPLETPQLPQAEVLVAELINDVAANSSPFLLVLDDYHLIQNEWIHQAVGFLVEHQPPEMHLVLLTRVDPPLPLARLRGRGLVTEIRDHDLRFTVQEAARFLQVMGLDLPAEAVSTLERRTEGWIVGLQMAAISMRGRKQDGDLSAFIEAFGGTNRYVLDYLMDEVLNQQAPAIRGFLLETSILERMCGDLCDAVRFGETESPSGSEADAVRFGEAESPSGLQATSVRFGEADAADSQAVLAHLERTNLFVIPLDDERRWYRYHHLFADQLTSTLRQRRSEEEIRELHRRAGRWHQSEGSLEEAMSHAMAAQDFERAASMIEQRFASMFSRSEVPVLLGWIDQLPEQLVRSRPWIDVYRANTLALAGRLEEVDALLDGVEGRLGPSTPHASELLGHIASIRAYAANLRGDAAHTIEMATLTAELLPEENLAARGMAAYALADTYCAEDDLDSASEALLNMLRVGEKTGQLMVIVPALADLAAIKKAQGRLYQAEEAYRRVHEWLVELNGLDSRMRCGYEFGLADLLCEWNQLDEAYEHAMIGVEFRRRLGGYWVVGDLPLMRILQARGDEKGALATLREAEQIVQTHHFQMAAKIAFRTAGVAQWLAVGDVEMASRWARECRGGSELEQIALARLWLAQGRAADAQRVLERQRALAEAGGRAGRSIEILSLQALALEALGRPGEADASLLRALSLARPEGYVRLFLELGQPLCELLERSVAPGTAPEPNGAAASRLVGDYVRDLLDAFQQEREARRSEVAPFSDALVDPLSERELEVLRLLYEGLSNKEIANRLIVAPSTVKQHLKNIYSKLDVHSRTQAVARGRELRLL
ncbi:MAG TPA: LuxR C-terminal-related transcriptional regulator [Anaerolineae bacterium]|nr:LuxR C-terminal-related transcriptional regulator [Anaerolineae bacterium]